MNRNKMVMWLIQFEEHCELLDIENVGLSVAAMMFDSGQTPCEAATMIIWGN